MGLLKLMQLRGWEGFLFDLNYNLSNKHKKKKLQNYM